MQLNEKQIILELERVLKEIAKLKSYSQRNSNKGYLKGLLFALGIDISKKIRLETVLKEVELFLDESDKFEIKQNLAEVFD